MPTQAERTATTVGELVARARELFAQRGFAATSIEDIVRAAGVTRGALYHHFDSKTDVFRAVFEEEQRRLAARIVDAAAGADGPLAALETGSLAFLEECLEPGLQRIFLIDGFAALGWEGVRELEGPHTMAPLRAGVEAAMDAGELERRPVEPVVSLVFGALCEAAMAIARAEDQEAMLRSTRREVQRLFAALG